MLLKRSRFLMLFCAAILAGTLQVDAYDDLAGLLNSVPSGANAVLAIDAEGLRNSPLGKSQNWSDRNEAAYVNTAFFLPPEAGSVIVASQMNVSSHFEQVWEAAVIGLNEPVTTRSLARAEGGTIEDIAGADAVRSPNDAYFVFLGDDTLGMYSPAHRQAVAQWVRSPKNQFGLSEFLSETVTTRPVNEGQIVMAIDLLDAVDARQLEERLSQSELLKNPQDLAKWKQVIVSLEGVRFTITVTDKIQGEIEVFFGEDPSVFGDQAKPALLSALNNNGVGLESFEQWTLNQSANSIQLRGELNESDFRKVMSLLELPSSNFSQLSDDEVAAVNDKETVIEASKAYYNSVTSLLDDLAKDFRTDRDIRRNYAATYMRRYGKRIDNLPILNVDTELVDFGMKVSNTLRDTSVTQNEANISAGVRTASVGESNNYGYYSGYRSGTAVKNQMRREEQSVALNARFGNWAEIQKATADIRVKMTQKYGVEF